MPAQPDALKQLRAHVRQLAEQGVQHDRHHHHVGLQKFTRVHRQVADARIGRDGFGDDQRQPHEAESETHADHNRRQRTRQHHLCKQAETAQAVAAGHLQQAAIDVLMP